MRCGTPWKPFVAGNEPQKGRIWGREGVTPPPLPHFCPISGCGEQASPHKVGSPMEWWFCCAVKWGGGKCGVCGAAVGQ